MTFERHSAVKPCGVRALTRSPSSTFTSASSRAGYLLFGRVFARELSSRCCSLPQVICSSAGNLLFRRQFALPQVICSPEGGSSSSVTFDHFLIWQSCSPSSTSTSASNPAGYLLSRRSFAVPKVLCSPEGAWLLLLDYIRSFLDLAIMLTFEYLHLREVMSRLLAHPLYPPPPSRSIRGEVHATVRRSER